MPDYQNGKIYKLVSYQSDNIYIGSTCQKLSKRKAEHKKDYKAFMNNKRNYATSFELIKHEDADIILLENCPCVNREELHKRERYYIENTENCVNKNLPARTKEENRELYKKWKANNKDKVRQYYLREKSKKIKK